MDIIDVILARALTPQGQIGTFAAMAQSAVQNANTAVSNITSITQQTNTNNENAATALENANAALAAVNDALENLDSAGVSIQRIDNEIDKFILSITTSMTSTQISKNLISTYPDGHTNPLNNILIMYQQSGTNTDGTMTQKAITQYVNNVKSELQTAINNINVSGGGGSTNLGSEHAGNIVVIGPDGNIIAGDATEADIIEALIKSGAYNIEGAVGMELDYENKVYSRTQDGKTLTAGEAYNQYPMYGGRMRCNVADDGTITAWYGDANYTDDGSNGQVMVYQPKFYYQRVPISTTKSNISGRIIRKESLILSSTPITGFKLHPIFINENNEEVDYVLLPAYESSIYDVSASAYLKNDESTVDFNTDKLSSIAGAKPTSGVNKSFNLANAEKLANNRGAGWHITNMKAESANQMLFMTEYGSPNSQVSLGLGVVNINGVVNKNCSSITGSTASLGNASGAAVETINEINGSYSTLSGDGKVAISYRGVENLWGNIWRMIGDTNLYNNGTAVGGIPYICDDYNYTPGVIGENYHSLGFSLPVSESYISAFGYNDAKYDWVFLPIECSSSANNILPIGDCLWTVSNYSGGRMLMCGGHWGHKEKAGMFCYAGDAAPAQYERSYSARLMFIPQKNTIYQNNINAWKQKVGG